MPGLPAPATNCSADGPRHSVSTPSIGPSASRKRGCARSRFTRGTLISQSAVSAGLPTSNSLQDPWPYGYSMPIAVRYTQDAFSRSGWLWPVDAKGEPLKATSYMAVGFYVAKYVNKKSDMDLAAKGLGAKEWNNSLKTKLS